MPQRGPTRRFTARELEIAEGIRLGRTYEQIAATLFNHQTGKPGISPHTVAKLVERMAWLFDRHHEFAFGEDGHMEPREIVMIYAWYEHGKEVAMEMLEQLAKEKARVSAPR